MVVTGAAQGIGLETTSRFLAQGAGVVAFDRNEARLRTVTADLSDRCVAFVGDVSRRDDCRRAVELCVERFGGIDVMCAHAGIAEPLPLLEMTDEHWRRHLDVNVTGTMHCVVEAATVMIAARRRGVVVCTTSINAWFVEETHAVYNVTKAAVWALIRSAAIDLAAHGIRVVGVAPGVVETPLAEVVLADPATAGRYVGSIPLGRFGHPQDVADAIIYLASDAASYITGQTIVIDGGQTLGIRGDLSSSDPGQ